MNTIRNIFFSLLLLVSATLAANVPQLFSYQGIVRDNLGHVAAYKTLDIKISIATDSIGDNILFAERHSITTNAEGLFTIIVGSGSITTYVAPATWAGNLYLIVHVNEWDLHSSEQIVGVPYALYASGTPYADSATVARHVPSAVMLAGGQTGLQTLVLSGDTISLSEGNAVKIPPTFSRSYKDVIDTPTFPTVPVLVSSFVNDTGYIDTVAEVQNLDSVLALGNSAGSQIKHLADPTLPQHLLTYHLFRSADSAVIALNGSARSIAQRIANVSIYQQQLADYGSSVNDTLKRHIAHVDSLQQSLNRSQAYIDSLQHRIDSLNYLSGNSVDSVLEILTSMTVYPPSVITTPPQDIWADSAIIGGNVVSNGGAWITARGVCWSTSPQPTTADNHIYDSMAGLGSFDFVVSNLDSKQCYYVRAFAVNKIGTGYGGDVRFCTTPHLPTVQSSSAINVKAHQADACGSISDSGGAKITYYGVCYSMLPNPEIRDDSTITMVSTMLNGLRFTIADLQPSTTYHYRVFAINSTGIAYGDDISFTTAPDLPKLHTTQAHTITPSTAIAGGIVVDNGKAPVTARGVCWSTEPNPTTNDSKTDNLDLNGDTFSVMLQGLALTGTYYYRAYATNSAGTAYGEQYSFATIAFPPNVATSGSSSVITTAAVAHGTIVSNGGDAISEYGFCYSTDTLPTYNDSYIQAYNINGGVFSKQITQLLPGTTYHYRAYAINSTGIAYGADFTFTTLTDKPWVATAGAQVVSSHSAIAEGILQHFGGLTLSTCGICFDTTPSPTIDNNYVSASPISIGSYYATLSNLISATTYYYRAYAINALGVSYGTVRSFRTSNDVPAIITISPTNITHQSATLGGNIISNGGTELLSAGVCWGLTAYPTLLDNTAAADFIDLGTFTTTTPASLLPGTTYHTRAYATNTLGTAYGDDSTFTTPPTSPTVTTIKHVYTNASIAEICGEVVANGGSAIREQGIEYSTSPTFATAIKKKAAANGVGLFCVSISNLSNGTTYFYRTYAINSVDTACGTVMNFSTSAVRPTVSTMPNAVIIATTATAKGVIESNGGSPITARGICYSTSPQPTTADAVVNASTTIDTFTATINGLAACTKYYYRAFATNALGTAYGNDQSFTTPCKPSVKTLPAVSITDTSATLQGNVTNDGGSAITARGIRPSTSPSLSAATVETYTPGKGNYSIKITKLHNGTTYYYCAYATNALGTAYGDTLSFTTPSLPTVVTSDTSNVLATQAKLGGNVTDDGGATVTARGIFYGYSSTVDSLIDAGKKIAIGSGKGTFSNIITNLSPNTTYYYCAYATNIAGTAYGVVKSFTTPPVLVDGMLPGEFSISATTKVHFSRGYLQYTTQGSHETTDSITPGTWRFAEHQWDHIGYDNKNISPTYTGWIDLFGFGTSGWNNDSTCYQPYSDSTNSKDYMQDNLMGENARADWGIYNAISNGGNYMGLWRTLTGEEFDYILNKRPNSSALKGSAYINNIYGRVILPDNWTLPQGCTFSNSNRYTEEEWEKKEKAGAVLLPYAGTRSGHDVKLGSPWSSFLWTSNGRRFDLYDFAIEPNNITTTFNAAVGYAVRLVRWDTKLYKSKPTVTTDSTKNVSSNSARIHGTITSDGNAAIIRRGFCYSTTSQQPTINTDKTIESSVTKKIFIATLSNLLPNTTYYVRAFVTTSEGTAYGEVLSFTTLSDTPSGDFSVSATRKIKFSKGNLQYNASSNTWRFAVHQWDFVGEDNKNLSPTYNGWIDLFDWGTGDEPTKHTLDTSDYSTFNDWGDNPALKSTLGDYWYTLNRNEWIYLLGENNTKRKDKCGHATVNGIAGIVLLPDAWTLPEGCSFTAGAGNNYNTNTYTSAQWTKMENAGAVFLPAAGLHHVRKDIISIGSDGNYWSSTPTDNNHAYNLYFTNIQLTAKSGTSRHYGLSVRLVKAANTTKTKPEVATDSVLNITASTAAIGAITISDGGSAITAAGVCYSTSANPTISDSKVQAPSINTGDYIVTISNLSPNTTYYYCAYATNSIGTAYGEVKSFTTLSDAPSGEFSVSATKKVTFSKGNLQYNASSNTWRFAEHQYDFLGNNNNYHDWIDLFGFGTGKIPDKHTDNDYDYSTFTDWSNNGQLKATLGGGWRTLSREEWEYLIGENNTKRKDKCGHATVNNVVGIVLLPDTWTLPNDCSFTAGSGNKYTTNTYTAEQWAKMEAAGAVFMPAAGIRYDQYRFLYTGEIGFYWCSTPYNDDYSFNLCFKNNDIYVNYNYRHCSQSVRLVR